LLKLNHPGIVRVLGTGRKGFIIKPNKQTTDNDIAYIKMQYIQGGTLLDFL